MSVEQDNKHSSFDEKKNKSKNKIPMISSIELNCHTTTFVGTREREIKRARKEVI